MNKSLFIALLAGFSLWGAESVYGCNYLMTASNDTLLPQQSAPPDTIRTDTPPPGKLVETDYERVSTELGVDIATVKAVIEIEAGVSHEGFVEPGMPVVNFDLTLFKRFMRRAKKNVGKHTGSTAFARPNIRKYGCVGRAQWARLESGRKIHKEIAEKATFWGMFQIGGFNWKQCGTESLDDFVAKMSESEAMQLELFARFIIRNNMVQYLREKNWARFSYYYNGPSYKAKRYHIRLAEAYRKYL